MQTNHKYGDVRDRMIGLERTAAAGWQMLPSSTFEHRLLEGPVRAYTTMLEQTAALGLVHPHKTTEAAVMRLLATPGRAGEYLRAYGRPMPGRFRDLPASMQREGFELFLDNRVAALAESTAAAINTANPHETNTRQTIAWMTAVRDAAAEYFIGDPGAQAVTNRAVAEDLNHAPDLTWKPALLDRLIRAENRSRVEALYGASSVRDARDEYRAASSLATASARAMSSHQAVIGALEPTLPGLPPEVAALVDNRRDAASQKHEATTRAYVEERGLAPG